MKPEACPWHSFSDPVVQEVLKYRWAYDPPNLEAAWGNNPLFILVEAMGVYSRAVLATRAEDMRLEEIKRKSQKQGK